MPIENFLKDLAENSLADFVQAAKFANCDLSNNSIDFQILPAPHRPPSLPLGKIAVYSFFFGETCLKVGKVGPNSGTRYLSQHYIPSSSGSNLARSLAGSLTWSEKHGFSGENVGSWIKENTARINFTMPEVIGLDVLALLEAFLHCRWKPQFEGKIT